jgi:tape measure domain-containing protein
MAGPELKVKVSVDGKDAGKSIDDLGNTLEGLDASGKKASASLQNTTNTLLSLDVAARALSQITDIGRNLVQLGDEYNQLASRISLYTKNQAEADEVMAQLGEIAQRTHAPLDTSAELFAKLAAATKGTGTSQQELLGFTEAINNALRVSGTTAAGAAGALTQLGQGLASGSLRGDEFNSVAEQMPVLLDAIAQETGMARSELREFAATGGITADIVKRAVAGMADEWATQAQKMPVTLEQALTDMRSAWQQYLGQSDGVKAASEALAGAIGVVAENLGALGDAAAVGGLTAVAVAVGKVTQALQAQAASLAANLAANRQAAQATAQRAAAEAEAAQIANISAKAQATLSAQIVAAKRQEVAATAAALAAAQQELAMTKQLSIYGEQRAAAERTVAAAKQANTAATAALTNAERGLAAATATAGAAAKGATAAQAGAAAAMGATTLAARTATVAMTGLRTVMGFLGGPVGAVLTAATALLYWNSTSKSTKDVTEEATAALDEMKARLDTMSKLEATAKLKELDTQLKELTERSDKLKIQAAGMADRLNGMVPEQVKTQTAQLNGLIKETEEQIARTKAKLEEYAAAQTAAGQSSASFEQAIKALGINLQEVNTGLTAAGINATSAFAEISTSAQASGDVILASFAAAMEKAKEDTRAQTEIMRLLKIALEEGQITQEQYNKAVEDSKFASAALKELSEAYKLLGVEMATTSGGMTESGFRVAEAFTQIATSADSSSTILTAYAAAMQKAGGDTDAMRAIVGQLAQALVQGKITADQYAQAMKQISVESQTVENSLKKLGVKSKAALSAAAGEARAAYEVIRDGGADLDTTKEAWMAYAEAAVAANGATASETLTAEAATLGLSEALVEIVGKQQANTEASRQQVDAYRAKEEAIDAAVAALAKEADAMTAAADAEVELAKTRQEGLEAEKEALELQQRRIEAEAAEAEAAGDTEAAKRLKIQAAELEIQVAKKGVEIARQQVEVAKLATKAAEAEAEAAKKKAKAYADAAAEQEKLYKQKKKEFAEDGFTEAEKEELARINAKAAGLRAEEISQKAATKAAEADIEVTKKKTQVAEEGVRAAEKRVDTEIKAKDDLIKSLEEEEKARKSAASSDKETASARSTNTRSTRANTLAVRENTEATRQAAIDAKRLAQEEARVAAEAERAAAAEARAAAAAARLSAAQEEAANSAARLKEQQEAAAEAAQEHARQVHDQVAESLNAADALQTLNQSLEQQLARRTGDMARSAEIDFQNQIEQIEALFLRSGEVGRDSYDESMKKAMELYRLEVGSLEEKGDISKEQAKDALSNSDALIAKARQLAAEDKEREEALEAQSAAIDAMTEGAVAMQAAFTEMNKEIKDLAGVIGSIAPQITALQGVTRQGADADKLIGVKDAARVTTVKTVKIDFGQGQSVDVLPGQEAVVERVIKDLATGRARA